MTGVEHVSYQTMVENHTSFYEVTKQFAPGAIERRGIVRIAGGDQYVPLWVCVEWDACRILLGYHWSAGNGMSRPQLGLEEWFLPREILDPILGIDADISREDFLRKYDMRHQELARREQSLILETTRFAQSLLDEASEDGGVGDDIKERVRRILTGKEPV